jgi:beta-lactam-binding protein with PASTA domain
MDGVRRHALALPVLLAALVLAACQSPAGPTQIPPTQTPPTQTPPTQTPPSQASGRPTGTAAAAAVPGVVGMRLSSAREQLSAAGFDNVEPADATGQHRVVLNPENWVVQSQDPAANSRVDRKTRITLNVRKPTDGSGSGTTTSGVVPDVLCKDLQSAQDTLQAAGFYRLGSTDGTGQGRVQIVDRNWVVTGQSAAAGSRPGTGTRIVLTVVKFGEPTGRSGCRS